MCQKQNARNCTIPMSKMCDYEEFVISQITSDSETANESQVGKCYKPIVFNHIPAERSFSLKKRMDEINWSSGCHSVTFFKKFERLI